MANEDLKKRLTLAFEEYPGQRHGLTRRIAMREGVTDQAVGRWKRTGQVQRDHLVGLAEELGVSVNWLLTGQGGMRPQKNETEVAVPLVGDTTTGVDPGLVGRRASADDDVVMVPRSFGPCFAIRVAGSPDLWPRYNEGEVVVVAAEAEPTVGFDVFVQRYGPEGVDASIWRLAWRMQEEVALDPVATRAQEHRLVVHLHDTLLCRPVLSIMPPTMVRRGSAPS